jgi:L-lactate dehydrogenase (cytochrome)
MKFNYNSHYPSIDDLREKAKKRIPKFAFEYLDGGCNDDINLHKNTSEIREVELLPNYLIEHKGSDMRAGLFGHTYDAPFGIALVGLQGLIWPKGSEILARAAFEQNIPFILRTVTTSSIERIGGNTERNAWFQLYHPTENRIKDLIINRLRAAGYPVLVILCDVPTFGYRPKDIRNGLAMPPKMSIRNILQIMSKPNWAIKPLMNGQPAFEILKPYMPKGLDLKRLGQFMDQTFSGRLNEEKIAPIRDMWKGKIVLKGVTSEADTEKAIKLGPDGIIISNHGGRQLDAGQSSIKPLKKIAAQYGHKMKVMTDSGLRSGPDIARAIASGAQFTFLGRSFMHGVGALGKNGGNHTLSV